jgi:hypothetical protein
MVGVFAAVLLLIKQSKRLALGPAVGSGPDQRRGREDEIERVRRLGIEADVPIQAVRGPPPACVEAVRTSAFAMKAVLESVVEEERQG